jgi:hypothetical protein
MGSYAVGAEQDSQVLFRETFKAIGASPVVFDQDEHVFLGETGLSMLNGWSGDQLSGCWCDASSVTLRIGRWSQGMGSGRGCCSRRVFLQSWSRDRSW